MISAKQTLLAAVAYLQEDERGAFDARRMQENADAIDILTNQYISFQIRTGGHNVR